MLVTLWQAQQKTFKLYFGYFESFRPFYFFPLLFPRKIYLPKLLGDLWSPALSIQVHLSSNTFNIRFPLWLIYLSTLRLWAILALTLSQNYLRKATPRRFWFVQVTDRWVTSTRLKVLLCRCYFLTLKRLWTSLAERWKVWLRFHYTMFRSLFFAVTVLL